MANEFVSSLNNNVMNKIMKILNPCAKEFTPKFLEKNKYSNIKRKFNEWLPNSSMNEKCKNENILLNFDLGNGNNYFNLVLQSNIIKTLLDAVYNGMVSSEINKHLSVNKYKIIVFISVIFSLILSIFILINILDIKNIQPKIQHRNAPKSILDTLKIKNKERIIIGHLNINHLEKKFLPLVSGKK